MNAYPHLRSEHSMYGMSLCRCGVGAVCWPDTTSVPPLSWGADCPAALREALSAAEKERDELRAALDRLQAPASDLPPVGTRWGDIPEEVRARLPVGTRLEPPAYYHMDIVFVRRADGLWYAEPDGSIPRARINDDRRILSYPPTERS